MNRDSFSEQSQLPKMEIKQMQQITSADKSGKKRFISKVLQHFAFNILDFFIF